MLATARVNSKKRGHPPPTLTIDDVESALEPGACAVTGIAFAWGTGARGPLTPSLDRIDASRPYTPDNFRVVLWAVNAGCWTWGAEAYLAIAARALGVADARADATIAALG
jgi:hypothetical protein